MKWLIPSYGRCGRVLTLKTLGRLGVDKGDIVVGVQTEDDFRRYKRTYGGYEIHLTEGATNAAGNRNGLASMFTGEAVAFVDDDVLGFYKIAGDGKGRTCVEDLDAGGFAAMLKEGFGTGADLWGVNVGGNPYFHHGWARRHGRVTRKALLIGDFIVMRSCGTVKFDDKVDMGEDYDISLTALELGFDVARLNLYMAVPYKPNGGHDGGCSSLYRMGDKGRHEMMKRQVVQKHSHTARFSNGSPDCCTVIKKRGVL